jgi:hypothetical protein
MHSHQSSTAEGPSAATEHLVHFYEDDSILLDTVDAFIGSGLAAGESAIFVATESHRAALAQRLSARGIDLDAAIADDQYIPLDAEETLSTFMIKDWPDQARFNEAAGEVLRRASRDGRRVRAYGEMVTLLWAQGNKAATIRLEWLWNRLGDAESFSLLCGYPKRFFADRTTGSHFSAICGQHSRVIASAQQAG